MLLTVAAAVAVMALVAGPTPARAAVIETDCNPSASGWDTAGAWGDGTVMEKRVCLHFDATAHRQQSFSYWRVRRGGTPISGTDWLLGNTIAHIYSITTTNTYGDRSDFGNALDTSIVKIQSYWGCSGQGGVQSYQAQVFYVVADPPGLPPSSQHNGGSLIADDSALGCS